jgi:hypothetical protein
MEVVAAPYLYLGDVGAAAPDGGCVGLEIHGGKMLHEAEQLLA